MTGSYTVKCGMHIFLNKQKYFTGNMKQANRNLKWMELFPVLLVSGGTYSFHFSLRKGDSQLLHFTLDQHDEQLQIYLVL